MAKHLLLFGLGYTGRAVAQAAIAQGWHVSAAMRQPGKNSPPGLVALPFDAAEPALADATCLLSTVPPDENGDPVLVRYGAAIAAAPAWRWAGYLSTTGVYGDRGGDWVDEATPPQPGSARSRRRVAAEQDWARAAAGRPLDILRLAGIYGPGRSAFDSLRAGGGRRVDKPGHVFGRIHRDDIVAAILAAIVRPPAGTRVLNLADDCPAEPARVTEAAAALLGMAPPPLVPFATAWEGMGPMARSFWSESRRVNTARTRRALGLDWRYPSYHEGLAAILAGERNGGDAS